MARIPPGRVSALTLLGIGVVIALSVATLTTSLNCTRQLPGVRFFGGHGEYDAKRSNRLTPFDSAEELGEYLGSCKGGEPIGSGLGSIGYGAAAAPMGAEASAPTDGPAESITNTQEAGVDEGGIVKTHGDHLVVLRRGRLFTTRLGKAALEPISAIDAYGHGLLHGAWYDEMLIDGDTIVVVGYSYARSATEVGVFGIDAQGQLSYRDTYFLRSNDYYSSRNYASRLIGDQLVFYMPYSLDRSEHYTLPALARRNDEWTDLISATTIYQPVQDSHAPVLHTVVSCDLGSAPLRCSARGVVGPYSRSFYVATDAVYLWVADEPVFVADQSDKTRAPSFEDTTAVLYRLPLVEGPPGAIRTWGSPVDQFSFKQDDQGYINVLVRGGAYGDGMWGSEHAKGGVALLRLPVVALREQVGVANKRSYVSLPQPSKGSAFQNRFVGTHLLYGARAGWGYARPREGTTLYTYDLRRGGKTHPLRLPHGIDRIEVLGDSAVVVGSNGSDLHFTAVSLGAKPAIVGQYVQERASQGEQRSHGFFYKPTGRRSGMLGLPIRGAGRPGYEHLTRGSAKILFLRVENESEFSRLGTLSSGLQVERDACAVSCVDWYGNARPIFYRGRVFALLGYELVEGRLSDGAIDEMRRASILAPLLRVRR